MKRPRLVFVVLAVIYIHTAWDLSARTSFWGSGLSLNLPIGLILFGAIYLEMRNP